MNPNQKRWNQQQQLLQRALQHPDDHQKTLDLFLSQHAMVHSAAMSQAGLWSFEDDIWEHTTEEIVRRIPRGCEHSIVWAIWHIARIEDVTMNRLVAGRPQLFFQDDWSERLNITVYTTGNAMDAGSVTNLSAAINCEALRAYRVAVGRRTREIVRQLQPEQLKQKVDPSRMQQVRADGAVVEAAGEILDYWSRRTLAGLLLMPATRHNFVHLNEAARLKLKRG